MALHLYVMTSLIIAFSVYDKAGLGPGASALGATALVFFAGAGLRRSLFTGTHRFQKLAGLVLAIIFMAGAHWLGKGFSAHVVDWDFTGTECVWVGFVICFVCTTKKLAAVTRDKRPHFSATV